MTADLEAAILRVLRANDASDNPRGLRTPGLADILRRAGDFAGPIAPLSQAVATLKAAGLVRVYRVDRGDGTRGPREHRLTAAGLDAAKALSAPEGALR